MYRAITRPKFRVSDSMSTAHGPSDSTTATRPGQCETEIRSVRPGRQGAPFAS